MNDSVHPVSLAKWSQTTLGLPAAALSSARASFGVRASRQTPLADLHARQEPHRAEGPHREVKDPERREGPPRDPDEIAPTETVPPLREHLRLLDRQPGIHQI